MKAKGFTLIEIIIALAISTVLFASAYTVMNTGTKFFHQQSGQVFARDDVRLVLNRITQDIQESKTVTKDASGIFIFTQPDDKDISYYYDNVKKAVIREVDDSAAAAPTQSVFLESVTNAFIIDQNGGNPDSFNIEMQTLNLSKYWGSRETEDHSITVTRRYGDPVYLPNPLKIRRDTLPDANQGQGYSWSLGAAGGTKPYTFDITSGSLPAGITMNSSGELSGTPTTLGTNTFTVTVKDSSDPLKTDSFQFTIMVISAPVAVPTDLFTYSNGDWEFGGNWKISPKITHQSQNDKRPAIYVKRKYSAYSYSANIVLKGSYSKKNAQESGLFFGPNRSGAGGNYFYIQVQTNGQTSVMYNSEKILDLGSFYTNMQVNLKVVVNGTGKLTLYINGTQYRQYSYTTQGDWLGIQEYNKDISAEYNILTI
jgi:prepilin-type N-terminal cleavage/methylation domain-containing protein